MSKEKTLEGALTLQVLVVGVVSDDANLALYGRGYTAREIVLGGQLPVPGPAEPFLRTLNTLARR